MINRVAICLFAVSLIGCGHTPKKMLHPEHGAVGVTDEHFTNDRDNCLAEFLQEYEKSPEAVKNANRERAVEFLDLNDLSAMLALTGGLAANEEAAPYVSACLEKKGWKQASLE